MEQVSAGLLWDLFKHIRSWLSNLDRAGQERKKQSVQALRQVITASRETSVYIREIRDRGRRDHEVERHLSVLWTNLGFALEDLGIKKLAKRCQIKGKHWADPTRYDEDFIRNADISLDSMEKLSVEMLHRIYR